MIRVRDHLRTIPACARNTFSHAANYAIRADHPGVRGEHMIQSFDKMTEAGMVPDRRGPGPANARCPYPARCSALRAGYQTSPTGSPAMFQLHETVGVMRM